MKSVERVLVNDPARLEFLNSLSPRALVDEVVRTGEIFSREEWIPVRRISLGGAIIDEKHAEDLGNKLKDPMRGQTQRIMVRCREGGMKPTDVGYDILDGFHRVAGVLKVGSIYQIEDEDRSSVDAIKAVVYYNCSDEEMFDQRIIAVNSVQSVQFARLASWLGGAWAQTPWASDLTIAQAFHLAETNGIGKKFGLQETQADAIKSWCIEKAQKWSSDVSTISTNLRFIDEASTDVISGVRSGKLLNRREAISPQDFTEIIKLFPKSGKRNNEKKQRKILQLAKSQALTSAQLLSFLEELNKSGGEELQIDVIEKIFESGEWRRAHKVPTKERVQESYTVGQVLRTLGKLEEQVDHAIELPEAVHRKVLREIELIRTQLDQVRRASKQKVDEGRRTRIDSEASTTGNSDQSARMIETSGHARVDKSVRRDESFLSYGTRESILDTLRITHPAAERFLSTWFNLESGINLQPDSPDENRFNEDLISLSENELTEVAKYTQNELFSLDPDERDRALDILQRILFARLVAESQLDFINAFISRIDNLPQTEIDTDTLSAIFDSLPDAIDILRANKILQRGVLRDILTKLRICSQKVDGRSRQSFIAWQIKIGELTRR